MKTKTKKPEYNYNEIVNVFGSKSSYKSQLGLFALSASFLIGSAHAITTHRVGNELPTSSHFEATQTIDSNSFWSAGSTDTNGIYTITQNSASLNGVNFKFDLAVSGGTTTDVFENPDAQDSLGSASSTQAGIFSAGDILTFTVSNISDSSVNFDGFVNFQTSFTGVGEGLSINGIDYLRGTTTNGDDDPRNGIALPGTGVLANGAQVGFVGTNALRGAALQFSAAVPEPSSVALLGLGSLGLLARRVRK